MKAALRNRLTLVGVVLFICLVLMAVFAPFLAPHNPYRQDVRNRLAAPSVEHPFGQDQFGRDILSRIIYGTRVSLLVGLTSVAVGLVLGAPLGIIAGYVGGTVERLIMRLVDAMLAFPGIITGLMLMALLGPGLRNMILAIGLSMVPNFARMAHGPTLALKEREFVQAAVAQGAGSARVMIKHIWPNLRSELLVVASLYTATAIRLEANLSFIGLGVAPPTPTWGQMIREGIAHLGVAPWYSITPGLAILIAVFTFNLIGDGLRDVFDPRTSGGG